jgi:excisionase family DNA binding protein
VITVRTLTRAPHGAPTRLRQVRHAIRLRNTHDPHALLSLIDAATAGRLLSVSPSWLLGLARRGQIPHYQLGAYVRFDVRELKGWLERHRSAATSGAEQTRVADGA